MTQFWRSGFWRTSSNGNLHEVSGHWVERVEWDRSGQFGQQTHAGDEALRNLRADRSATSSFTNPNADCPVCGAAVFFYQNNFGSRVYFDELGPPWPKHPCTDQPFNSGINVTENFVQIGPEPRDRDQWSYINNWMKYTPRDPKREFWEKYGTSQWNTFEVSARLNLKPEQVLVLTRLDALSTKKLYVSGKRFPKALSVHDVVFEYKSWVSFLDPASLTPVEMEVKKLGTASAVIDRVVTSQSSRQKPTGA